MGQRTQCVEHLGNVQRERYLGSRRERRMAAQQQQRERVVLGRGLEICWFERDCGLLPPSARRLVAPGLDAPPRRGPDQPGFGVARQTVGRPLNGSGQECFLYSVLATRKSP